MYLSRLLLNPRSRAVRRDLADCQALHRTVMSAFPDEPGQADARSRLGVLHRLESHPRTGLVILLVQSRVQPDWSRLEPDYLAPPAGDLPNPACKPVAEQYAAIEPGLELAFRLRANPTRKIDTKSRQDGQRRNGRRVELRTEAEQLKWLTEKASRNGFQVLGARVDPRLPVLDVRSVPEAKVAGRRAERTSGEQRRLTFGSVLFEGRLRVTDAEAFRGTLEHGLGSAKAYGFGLLSVAPIAG